MLSFASSVYRLTVIVRNKTVVILLTNSFIGFWLDFGKHLGSQLNCKVIFLALTRTAFKHVEALGEDDLIFVDDFLDVGERSLGIRHDELSSVEAHFDVSLSWICNFDRGLGYGFHSWLENFPAQRKVFYRDETRFSKVSARLISFYGVCVHYDVEHIVGSDIPIELDSLKKMLSIKTSSLCTAKNSNFYYFADDAYRTNAQIIERIKLYRSDLSLVRNQSCCSVPVGYTNVGHMLSFYSSLNTIWGAARRALEIFLKDTYKLLKGTKVKDGYPIYAWLKPVLSAPLKSRIIKKYQIQPSDLKNLKIYYFPLHLEPEVSLFGLSPEFHNSFEIIVWISKNLRFDEVLVVKEHPLSVGVRSKSFYEKLLAMPRVKLSGLETGAEEWLRVSNVVVALTGTIAIEAIRSGNKKILSFGRHQMVNYHQDVFQCESFRNVSEAIATIRSLSDDFLDCVDKKISYYYDQAVNDYSIDLPQMAQGKINHKKMPSQAKEAAKFFINSRL